MYSENSTLMKYCLGHSTIDSSYFGKGVCHPLSTQRTRVRGSLGATDYYSNDYCGEIGHKCCHLLAILHEKFWSPGLKWDLDALSASFGAILRGTHRKLSSLTSPENCQWELRIALQPYSSACKWGENASFSEIYVSTLNVMHFVCRMFLMLCN